MFLFTDNTEYSPPVHSTDMKNSEEQLSENFTSTNSSASHPRRKDAIRIYISRDAFIMVTVAMLMIIIILCCIVIWLYSNRNKMNERSALYKLYRNSWYQ